MPGKCYLTFKFRHSEFTFRSCFPVVVKNFFPFRICVIFNWTHKKCHSLMTFFQLKREFLQMYIDLITFFKQFLPLFACFPDRLFLKKDCTNLFFLFIYFIQIIFQPWELRVYRIFILGRLLSEQPEVESFYLIMPNL